MLAKANSFRWLFLNQRIEAQSPFLSRAEWEANDVPPEVEASDQVFAGLDLSASRDLTALVLVFPKDGEYHIVPHFWLPEDGLRDKSTEREGPLGCMGAARVFDHHRRASHPARGYCFGSG